MNAAVKRLSTVDSEDTFGPGFLCFPPAGATVLSLRGFAKGAAGIEMWGVEYPGHGERLAEPRAASFASLAEGIARETIDRFGAERFSRITLIGFSMGAFAAFEVAQRIRGRGLPGPAALVVVGACAPQSRVPGRFAKADATDAGRLLDQNALAPVAGYGASPELREYALDLLLGDLLLTDSYAGPAQLRLACPIVAIRGEDDPVFAADGDTLRAWGAWTSGRFTDAVVPGGHLGMLAPDRAPDLRELIHRSTFDAEPVR
ncbi:thioesterase II family protein [Amycolatopsis sp. NPDC049868]|uniref:thioesterase II family protein n=1 Tax=Amycolatopsis sp. NPDC049868 TaxID=3363934 RepID=UPI00378DDDF7